MGSVTYSFTSHLLNFTELLIITWESDKEVAGENERVLKRTNLGLNFCSVTCCVIVGKSLSFSELQFSHLQNGYIYPAEL